jgi:F-type H+-transporting ATPase subunit b
MIARLVSLAAIGLYLSCVAYALAQEAPESAFKADEHAKGEGKASETAVADEHGSKGGKGGVGDAHHDPYDLSHANATPSLADPSAFKADSAIFTFILFLLLLAILIKFAWKPIAHGLELRERGIEEKIEQARLAAEQATAQLKQYEGKLAVATIEAQQIIARARQDADAAGQKLLAEAQAAATKERERAVADIGVAKNQALREIAEKSVDTAIGLARNIIRREVRPGDHEQLIQDALKQFPTSSSKLN